MYTPGNVLAHKSNFCISGVDSRPPLRSLIAWRHTLRTGNIRWPAVLFFVFRSSNPRTYSTCTANLCRNIRTWSERTFLRWWCCCARTASRETADTERATCWLSYRLSTTTRRFNNLQFLLSPGHHRHWWFLLIRITVTYIFIRIILLVVLARFVHCKVSFSPFWTSYSKKRIKSRCTDAKYPFSWWTRLNSE